MQLRVINGMAEVLITDSRSVPCLDAANWVEFQGRRSINLTSVNKLNS